MAVDPFFGSVLGAVGNLVGGIFGNEAQRKANETAQEHAVHQQNLQQEAMMKGVTWKARDVMQAYKETGIHPLQLLGTSGPSYSPVALTQMGGSPVGESIGRAGQNISSGIHANADRALRSQALMMQEVMMNHAMERGGLENELLRTQIASEQMRMRQVGSPGMPNITPGSSPKGKGVSDSQGVTSGIGVEKQIIPDLTVMKTPSGGYVIVPSKEAKDRMEDMAGLDLQWFVRNVLQPLWSTEQGEAIAQNVLPYQGPLYRYKYNPALGEWNKVYISGDYRDPFKGERDRREFGRKLRSIEIKRPY